MLIDDIALALDQTIDPATAAHLMECFGTSEAIFAASAEELAGKAELAKEAAESILSKRWHARAEQEEAFARRNNINVIPVSSPGYPQMLAECPDRPHVIYVKGETDMNAGRWLSVVGTRSMTPYGKRICEELIAGLAAMFPDLVIVSGLAYGVDVTANAAALECGVKSIAVFGTPMTHIYPSQHVSVAKRIVDRGGALVSEYSSIHISHRNDFVARNRIIAGLSAGTLVVESAARGGSLYTADMADGYHRTAMAVPGRASDKYSEGTNRLIKIMKAQMVCTPEDIAGVLGWEPEKPADTGDAPQTETDRGLVAARLLSVLGNDRPVSVDEIIAQTGFSAGQVSAALFELEMEGAVDALPGKQYVRI